MNKEKFSLYNPPFTSVVPIGEVSLDDVWERLTDHTLKDQTEHLRRLLQEGKRDEYKQRKGELLPSATFGGVFDYRSSNQKTLQEKGKRGLLSTSGLMIIDADHLSEIGLDAETLKKSLSEDREIGVRLIFVSPSGDGVKFVCKVSGEIPDAKTYKEVYKTLLSFVSQKYGIPIGDKGLDSANSDITRTCLLPHDPTAIIRDWDSTFSPEDHPLPKVDRQTPLREIVHLREDEEDGVEEIVRRVESSGVDIAPAYQDYISLVYSFTSLGERGRDYLHRVCRSSPKYNPESTDKDFDNCSNTSETQSIGYFINRARQMGIDVTRPVERPGRDSREVRTSTITKTTDQETPPQTEEERYSYLMEIPEIGSIVSQKREGIKTGYKFGQSKGKGENLTLRSGAITLICGKPSHCKSKLLQNIALNLAKESYNSQEEESVLFFTYEEELADVLLQFANIDTNIPGLSQYGTPNTDVIKDLYTTGDSSRCLANKKTDLRKGLNSFNTLYKSGRLRVYYSDMYSQELCNAIRYLATQMKIKAVFVDYVQLLYREGSRKDRREEIKDICNDLRTTAIDLGLPIVLSAQLNKDAKSPTEMSSENVADCYDLARYANTIVCLWNSALKDDVRDVESYLDSKEYGLLDSRGFELGKDGKLYAKITKNRGGSPNIDAILDFTGETGHISINDDLPEDELEETHRGLKIW